MRLAVLGSGGIGGYYGALLAKGGHDVVFIARGAHLVALQQRGLTVRTPEGESTTPVSAVGNTKRLAQVDLVLFCVKSYDTEPAAQALRGDGRGARRVRADHRLGRRDRCLVRPDRLATTARSRT